jgi:hypothetical protein
VIVNRPSDTPPITPSLTACQSAAAQGDAKPNNGTKGS